MHNTTFYQDFHISDGVLCAYTGRDEAITVPDGVHTIGEGAFKACVSLKKVVLPDHLHHILSGAFKGCRKLESIHIPEEVFTIGDYAFHRCHALTSISLPPSVEELGDCVFLYCDSLTQVEIPGVKRMGKQVFVNDVLLQKILISPWLQEDCICDVFTGCSRLSHISFFRGPSFPFSNAVEAVVGEMEVPSLVRVIAADVLRMMELDGRRLVKFLTNLKHVEIPEGIEQIGKSSFFDKRGILSITFPASLKEIESRAFRNCISLETVRFQNDSVIIHEDAFKNCSSLKEVCTSEGSVFPIEGIPNTSWEALSTASGSAEETFPCPVPALVQTIHQQVLGNFRISGTILLSYLGDESRVLIPDGITRIAEEAFAGKESIDRVILPDSLVEIGAGAFRDCLLLQTIPLPDKLCRIGEGAFEHCVKLLSVALPEKLIHLEAKVFKHCRKLKKIDLGERLETIGEQAFYGCAALKEIHLPKHLTFLGAMAFYRCTSLDEICLLPGINQVGNLAFAQSGIRKARLCGSGKGYGSDLFFGCRSLSSITLESGFCHIPDKLAYNCTTLKKVIFPPASTEQSLQITVGRNAWENTPFLENWRKENLKIKENLEIEENLENAQSFADEIFWDGRNLYGEVYLPEHTRCIAGGAFYGNKDLTAVYIPDKVTWIGPAAFKGCSSLRYVLWSAKVENAEAEVFSGCTSLEKVEKRKSSIAGESPNNLPAMPAFVSWLSIGERAFYRCHNLLYLALDRVKSIGKEAFFHCYSFSHTLHASLPGEMKHLNWIGEGAFEKVWTGNIGNILISGQHYAGEVRIPPGIKVIAPYAFSRNQKLTRLILPDSLQVIGEGAFWGCSHLVQVDFPSHIHSIGAGAFEKCTSLLEIRLCACQVNVRAFACCTGLKKAELAGLLTLENRLFEHCISLEECLIKQTHPQFVNNQKENMVNLYRIGDYCFSGCSSLKDFDFSSVREIGCYAFQNCDGLSSIFLDDNTILRPHAFEDCGRLKQVQLTGEQGIQTLYEYALSGCTALKEVVCKGKRWTLKSYRDILSGHLPPIVRLLFHSAFSCFFIEQEEILCGYRGLGRIVRIPYGIRRIEAEVFRDVLMLKEVEIPETVDWIGARAFHGTAWMEEMRRQNPMVTVNHMLLDGSQCEGEVSIPQDIRLVCGWAFAGGMGIQKIRFLSDRVKVEAYAFRNCIYLEEMEFSDGTKIRFHGISDRKRALHPLAMQAVMDRLNCFKTDENNRLIECTGNISCLRIAHGITAIGDRVFQDGNLLTEITLPATVTSIGKFAFSGCKWLKAVKQAQSVTSIGERAFAGCGALERIELSENLAFIGARAFENCTSLEEILLPEGLEEIPDRAFFRCHSLKRIFLPSTLKRIGKEVFAFCKNLEISNLPEGVFVEIRAFAEIHGQKVVLRKL